MEQFIAKQSWYNDDCTFLENVDTVGITLYFQYSFYILPLLFEQIVLSGWLLFHPAEPAGMLIIYLYFVKIKMLLQRSLIHNGEVPGFLLCFLPSPQTKGYSGSVKQLSNIFFSLHLVSRLIKT